MNKKIRNALCILLAVFFTAGGLLIISAFGTDKHRENVGTVQNSKIPSVSGNTYYVDATANEGNDGLSPDKAFKTLEEVNNTELKPGDQVLFKRDCIWNGGLVLKYSGTEEAPISYGVYGEGVQAPQIKGNGQVYATVYGADISFVEIRNLEVTNQSDQTKYLRGIFINSVNEDVEGVKIQNCYVHDVDSMTEAPLGINARYGDVHWCGGIVVRAGSGANTESTSILKDITVEGNRVENCSLTGITVGGIFPTEHKSKNVRVVDNYVKECYGDGIIMFNCDGGLIQGNVSDHNGASNRADLYFVGIWTIWSDNTLIQYNESFGQGISGDGQGFDIDGTCKNTILQYNYSHDNYGGFLLLIELNNGRTIVRYNVSQNDGGKFLKISFNSGLTSKGSFTQADIYNNTYFTNQTIENLIEFDSTPNMPDGRRLLGVIKNNIFCFKGALTPDVVANNEYYDYITFENNCWYGFSDMSLPMNEENQIVGDPKFSFAGSGSKGFDSLSGYKLLSNSPCLETGADVYNDGGLDFWGNKIGESTNVGAYAGDSVKMPKDANIALSQSAAMSSVKALPIMKEVSIAKLVDGSVDELVSTQPTDNKDEETWFEVEFAEKYDISKVVLKPGKDNTFFPQNLMIQVWNGEQWETVAKKNNCKATDEGNLEIKFDAVQGSKVRIHVTKMRSNAEGMYASQLAEIEIYQ